MKTKNAFRRWTIFRKGSSFLAWVLFLGVTFLGGLLGPSQAQRPFEEVRNDIIPDRFIVVLRDEVRNPRFVADDITRFYGLSRGHVYTRALKGFSAFIPPGLLGAVQGDPDVAFVEPDRRVYAIQQTLPTGVDRIDVDQNATAKVDGVDERVDVDIAIIDTGIDPTHPDLNFYRRTDCARNAWWGAQCRDGQGDDGNGHGTHVAGIAAALDNGIGVVGVAPGARLWSVRVLNNNGSGYLSWLIGGIDWVTAHADEIEVANMSLSWVGNSAAARQAIQNSVDAGVVYVVAAGNDSEDVYGADGTFGTSDDHEPASYPEVATISALSDTDGQPGGSGPISSWGGSDRNGDGIDDGADDSFAWFSNFSASVVPGNPVSSPGAAIDLVLPGVDIYSTWRGGTYNTISGTSMASPHGAGLAALYIAANGRATDAAGVYAIRQALIDGGVVQNDALRGLAIFNDPDSNPNWEKIGWAGPLGPVDSPPSVTITSPAEGTTVSGIVNVTADATDDNGVTQVEFFADGASIGVDTNGADGWSASWNTSGVSDGGHTVTATATDTIGQTASDGISVTVDNVDEPPTVSITSPADGATVSGTVNIVADATDDKGVTQVEFFVDGAGIGVDTNGADGWSASWNTSGASDGDHTVAATVTDTIGQTASDSFNVTVNNSAPSALHVGDLDGTSTSRGWWRWRATVTIAVHDENHNPVSGATASGGWSGAYSGTGSCTTGSNGHCSVTSGNIRGWSSNSVTFTVGNVAHATLTYDSGSNHDPDGDSNGTSITVPKP